MAVSLGIAMALYPRLALNSRWIGEYQKNRPLTSRGAHRTMLPTPRSLPRNNRPCPQRSFGINAPEGLRIHPSYLHYFHYRPILPRGEVFQFPAGWQYQHIFPRRDMRPQDIL